MTRSRLFILTALIAAMAGSASACPSVPEAQTELTSAISALNAAGYEGAVVVMSSRDAVLCTGRGNAADGLPFAADVALDVGSIAKPVTAMAIMRLVEDGALSLEDPISRWFDAPPPWASVTVRQLLLHTGGMPEYAPGDAGDYTRVTSEQLTQRLFAAPPAGPIGEWSYSNPGYSLLALIVERASGRAFADALEIMVFEPAGVRASLDPSAFTTLVEGHVEGGGWTNLRQQAASAQGPFWGLWGAGGLYMSTLDLARLSQAYFDGHIVRPDTVQLTLQPGVTLAPGQHGGLVWAIEDGPHGPIAYFNGAGDNTSADVRYDTATRTTVATGSNGPNDAGLRAGRLLSRALASAASER